MAKITVRVNRARSALAALVLGHGPTMAWADSSATGAAGPWVVAVDHSGRDVGPGAIDLPAALAAAVSRQAAA
ncbi:hypothetical protein [Wenjunlia tyrosinilytica]|uniref:Uncharacterized protein n=1 Tax=Wenjunlia tyrosinilytica TaxID=1544741 RepID=A0A917ZUD1_9ACTN|nr:hypothetical protein [Wenjunlia tyrosinilytica]GGO92197.1 hypothetical protein GCM10012280_41820 [Wenjunlia tyrosinilytica]